MYICLSGSARENAMCQSYLQSDLTAALCWQPQWISGKVSVSRTGDTGIERRCAWWSDSTDVTVGNLESVSTDVTVGNLESDSTDVNSWQSSGYPARRLEL